MNMRARGFKKLVALSLFTVLVMQFVPGVFASYTIGDEIPENSLSEMEELLNSTTYEEFMAIRKAEGFVPFKKDERPAAVSAVFNQ